MTVMVFGRWKYMRTPLCSQLLILPLGDTDAKECPLELRVHLKSGSAKCENTEGLKGVDLYKFDV